jgi:hypothetical protein
MSDVVINNPSQRVRQIDSLISTYPCQPLAGVDDVVFCTDRGIAYVGNRDASILFDKTYSQEELDFTAEPVANEHQLDLVVKYAHTVLNIGIGSGDFVKLFPGRAYGYDMNDSAVEWLHSRNSFLDPHKEVPDAIDGICLWASLPHITSPCDILTTPRIGSYAFLSIPIISDFSTLSSHPAFNPGSIYYYFSSYGLKSYMHELGYDLIETMSGTDGLTYFAFLRMTHDKRDPLPLEDPPVESQSVKVIIEEPVVKKEPPPTNPVVITQNKVVLKKSEVKVTGGTSIPQLDGDPKK